MIKCKRLASEILEVSEHKWRENVVFLNVIGQQLNTILKISTFYDRYIDIFNKLFVFHCRFYIFFDDSLQNLKYFDVLQFILVGMSQKGNNGIKNVVLEALL